MTAGAISSGKEFSGSRALVTGGAKRIGRAIALALAGRGADVALHYFRSEVDAASCAREIESRGQRAVILQADLSDPAQAAKLALDAVNLVGPIDILINSAATWPDREKARGSHGVLNESLFEWDQAMAVNARAPFFLIQALAPQMKQIGRGRIVNLLDRCISIPFKNRAAHTVSKTALLGVTKLAASSLQPEITVTGIELGPVVAPEEMDDPEQQKKRWIGMDRAVEGVIELLLRGTPGQILQIV
jgi:NAD(P)-dependent dehydrogenase (short-subunit alcohol dehydrogenase family)